MKEKLYICDKKDNILCTRNGIHNFPDCPGAEPHKHGTVKDRCNERRFPCPRINVNSECIPYIKFEIELSKDLFKL
jgi:hypothetical protein